MSSADKKTKISEIKKIDKDLLCWGTLAILSKDAKSKEVGRGFVEIIRWIIEKNKNGILSSTLKEIATETGKSIGTIQATIKSLKESEFISLKSGKGRVKRVYKINIKKVSEFKDQNALLWAGMVIFSKKNDNHDIGRGFISIIGWIVENQKDGFIETSLRDISFKIGRSVGTAQFTLSSLKKNNFLSHYSGKGRQVRIYKLEMGSTEK